MIEVSRTPDLLVVSEGPSAVYRLAAGAWPLVALTSFVGARLATSAELNPGGDVLASLTGLALPAGALLVMLALLRGWRTTAHRFDRLAGTLVISRHGPVRTSSQRQVLLDAVAEVVDRRSPRARSVELVLADRSTLTIVRTRRGARALDSVTRELSDLLGMPVSYSEGTLVAERFEIERLVEQGGMGVVYRALDRSTGQRVALKLALAPTDDAEQAERFAREIGLLATFDHPRIVRHASHGVTADGRVFLAMQWLEGEDLRVVLGRGALSLEDSLRLLEAAAEAVAAVHARGVVHRDLKPGNLFLRGGDAGDLLLLDFGIARRFDHATRLTGSRAILGTPHYMAPEQASSAREVQPGADIFSLGCIFYECLTGKHPFDAPQLIGVLARILFDNPEPIDQRRSDIPQAWISLLYRMLSKDPSRRPADGAALLRELRSLPASQVERGGPEALACGAASGAAPPGADSGDRVLVSVVLATLVDASLGPTSSLDRFLSIRGAMNRFNCPIERLADGSLLATVLPQHSATDQARIAASCALYLRELLPEARLSVATGRAELRSSLRVGDAVDRAVLLLESATAAQGIRLDAVTAGLIEGHFLTRSREGSIVLLGERQNLDESRPLLGKPTPCVGRELELLQLEGLMSSAADEAVPRAGVVLGPPGIGKSRLRHELSRRLRERYPDGVLLVGYGDPLSAGSPYVLVGDALRRHAGIRAADEPEAARAAIVEQLGRRLEASQRKRVSEFLGELCGVPFAAETSPPLAAARGDHRVMSEQITMAFLDWLSAECQAHPVSFVLEDVQWADALSLKLLEGAIRDLRRSPLSVLALGRPEAELTFPKMFSGQRSLSLSLGALSNKASELLVTKILGAAISAEVLGRIVRLAAGNALFLEELIRSAAEGKAGDVPETVLAMLQARLSRLSPEARLLLRSASVFGERFWQAGVLQVASGWAPLEYPADCLTQPLDEELVERGRTSRFPGEVELSFRHALVCDAAYGLLTDTDRAVGHAAAGHWLEGKGETDAVVLARHAKEGGERARAVSFYTRAAEQSLGQYDFEEARARALEAVACGAEGHTLGVLESVQSAALYSMGQWLAAAEIGMLALSRLPRGSSWWCATVEKLMQVLPNTNQQDRARKLSDELLEIMPAPEASAAYIRALHTQLLGYAVSGDHERGWRSLDFIDRLGTDLSEPDVATRGYARLWRSVFHAILSDELELAGGLCEEAIVALSESQVMYRLSLAHIVRSFILWQLGELERSEHAARAARAMAEQIHDEYHAALAAWYLALALADRSEPEKLEDAERCARVMVLGGDNPMFQAISASVLARVAIARGDWARAEGEGRKARAGLVNMPPYRLMSAAYLVQALGRQGRFDEACAIAREELALLESMNGTLFTEVLFRAAAAEALLGAGHHVEGRRVLAGARQHIQFRADRLSDPELRLGFLKQRHENRWVDELERWSPAP